jgi:hypothetical protein
MVLAPFERVADASASVSTSWAWAVVLAAWQWARGDAFVGLLPIVILAGLLDFFYGVKAARKNGAPYDSLRAHIGIISKSSSLAILLLIRLVEGWAHLYAIVDTKGMIAVAVAVFLVLADVRSIAGHREALGGKPIPFLSTILDWVQGFFLGKIPLPRSAPRDDAGKEIVP